MSIPFARSESTIASGYCPFCHHGRATIWRANEPEASGSGCRDIMACLECGCRYPVPRLSPSGSREYLDSFDQELSTACDCSSGFEQGVANMQTLLAAHVLPGLDLQPGARSLDIGSLSGQVPAALGRIGFRASGIEPMRSFAAFAKDRGLDVRQGLFPMAMPLGLTEERFDLVTCFEVIYYFHDLRGCMAALKNLLTPGGWLAIKCLQGDAAYFSRHSLFSRYKDNLQAAPTAKSLQRWLSASGFDVKRLTALPEDRLRNMWDLNLPGVLHKGQTLLNLALGCLCGPGRADRIMVIAQRRK